MSRLRSQDFSVAQAVSRFGHMGGLQELGAPFRWIQKANLGMGYMRFMFFAVYGFRQRRGPLFGSPLCSGNRYVGAHGGTTVLYPCHFKELQHGNIEHAS